MNDLRGTATTLRLSEKGSERTFEVTVSGELI